MISTRLMLPFFFFFRALSDHFDLSRRGHLFTPKVLLPRKLD